MVISCKSINPINRGSDKKLAQRQDWYMLVDCNPGRSFKGTPQCRRSNDLYAIVSARCASNTLYVEGSIPSPRLRDSSVVRATVCAGSSPAPTPNGIAQVVERYTFNVAKEVHRFSKNGERFKGRIGYRFFLSNP